MLLPQLLPLCSHVLPLFPYPGPITVLQINHKQFFLWAFAPARLLLLEILLFLRFTWLIPSCCSSVPSSVKLSLTTLSKKATPLTDFFYPASFCFREVITIWSYIMYLSSFLKIIICFPTRIYVPLEQGLFPSYSLL